jgi:hypothetical protein
VKFAFTYYFSLISYNLFRSKPGNKLILDLVRLLHPISKNF